jgi:hypothetical protein
VQFGVIHRNVSYPPETSFFLFMKDDLTADPVPFNGGFMELSKEPGNGAVIDADKL